jgi:hypothetical protein
MRFPFQLSIRRGDAIAETRILPLPSAVSLRSNGFSRFLSPIFAAIVQIFLAIAPPLRIDPPTMPAGHRFHIGAVPKLL